MADTNSGEFKAWPEIKRFSGIHVQITEKIHGTNAQIDIASGKARAAGRTRYLSITHDNFGFASWVATNEADIVAKLGEGRHYGEWVGPGINNGYGLTAKRLVLFTPKRYEGIVLPDRVDLLPILYDGVYSPDALKRILDQLKEKGSTYAPGCMTPEGVVIDFVGLGLRRKVVFSPEEVAWSKVKSPRDPNEPRIDHRAEAFVLAGPYLQPVRLQKLMMRESSYRDDYPATLPKITAAYIEDLEKETPDISDNAKEALRKIIFVFVKSQIEAQSLVV